MARINIEENFFGDTRFLALTSAVNDAATAIGICVLVWRAGQKYFCDDRPIPSKIFNKIEGATYLIEVGLARRVRGGVYVCGSHEYFEWILKKREASRKGGESLKKKWAMWQPVEGPPTPTLTPTRTTTTPPPKRTAADSFFSEEIVQEIIKKFPNKIGAIGLLEAKRHLEGRFRSHDKNPPPEWEDFKKAVDNYIEAGKDTPPRYLKNLRNFLIDDYWKEFTHVENKSVPVSTRPVRQAKRNDSGPT